MCEFIQIKCISATELTFFLEMVKQGNVNGGIGNVKYSGIFTLLTGTLHTKDHIELILSASEECQWYITPTRRRWSCCPIPKLGMVTMGANND